MNICAIMIKNNAKIKEKRFNYETNYPYPAKNI